MTQTTSPAAQAVILFGHGARDPEWAGPMQRIRENMLARAPGQHVELAFLEFMSPTLDLAVDALVARGVTRIAVVPVFLAQGGHLKRDVPVLLDAARQRHPGCEFRLSLAVGEAPGVVAAIADYGLSALG
ncbi:MAG: cobalamin biosynthesis protein CbiX [Betaproteobacteria bacterium HGW-Betaproteobacteria-13]|jgi:sirohydrochlorin cobaltochelatase|uniref:Cobalamin biosynthesis protein CbiX n=1 Tax=Parazoarcus communis TaxID=41977 RepID=A0A2U8GXI1_9RHOO|nr:CbiX/SirB N-terminal domain-containing protein [Parazoarcus communis]AWI78382.1 cobalamin biosynthesis protein CbiX [Parazoarcus communis]PKO81565.1 MAG: cobalamin biosynthesis protein CbiX [Betaproteobacteria bacterium HGW-Betaproteobacteria-13]